MKLKLTLEYAGENFSGWQRQQSVGQVGVETVQGALERALGIFLQAQYKKRGHGELGEVPVTGSGRTDAGVHARGQVASLNWPVEIEFSAKRLKEAINALTPPGLVVRSIEEAPDTFDARISPHIKCYSYRLSYRGDEERASKFTPIDESRVWCLTRKLDIGQMIRAARVIQGQHDFQSFRAKDCSAKSTVRTIVRSELVRVSDRELIYFVHGKGFLKQMVRILVGTLVELGECGEGAEKMMEILAAKDRTKAGQTAPAKGLTMEWVSYGDYGYE